MISVTIGPLYLPDRSSSSFDARAAASCAESQACLTWTRIERWILLERVAAGEEIVITSDGRPKAKLVGIPPVRATYRVNRRLLAVAPRKAGAAAEKMIRQDRDGRD